MADPKWFKITRQKRAGRKMPLPPTDPRVRARALRDLYRTREESALTRPDTEWRSYDRSATPKVSDSSTKNTAYSWPYSTDSGMKISRIVCSCRRTAIPPNRKGVPYNGAREWSLHGQVPPRAVQCTCYETRYRIAQNRSIAE